MKLRKVSAIMKPYIKTVLEREQIPYSFTEEGMCQTNLSSLRYSEILEDALCLLQKETTGINTVSVRTLGKRKKMRQVVNPLPNGVRIYSILNNDKAKY